MPPGWKKLRAEVLERDGHRCQERLQDPPRLCGRPATHVDHITPAHLGGHETDPANLQALCSWHHRHKTATEAGRASARRRQSRMREAEPHPGLLRP